MSIDFRRAKVGTLLSVGVVLIIGLMVSATIYSNYLSSSALTIIRNSTTRIFDVLTIQRDTEELFSAMQDVVVFQDQQRLESSEERIETLLERADKTIQEAGEKGIFNDEEFKKAEVALEKAREVSGSVIKTKINTLLNNKEGDFNEKDDFYERNVDSNEQLTRLRNVRFEMLGVFHEMTIRSDEEFNEAMDRVLSAQVLTWLVIGISLVLAASLAIFLVRSVKQIFDLKNEFVNIIAHDLRNPITAINGYLEMITSDKDKNKTNFTDNLQAIKVSALKLGYQINNLLEVGRTEAGHVKLMLEKIQPFEVLEESVIRAKALAEISGIKIIIEKGSDKKVYVLADRSKLSDVLDNLISNAIKYNSQKGTVTIITEDSGDQFSISVTDTGKGIPEDQKGKIFKKYSRLNTDKEKKIKGTGLGLYAAKLSMDNMKGKISFESKENKGTTFTISLNKTKS